MLFLFADDMTLVITGKRYEEIAEKANSGLNLSIFCDNVSIVRVYKTKILSITFDPDLRFSTFIEELRSKFNKRISFMSILRHYVSLNAIVLPHFDYGILLYGFTNDAVGD
jgi:hypothetical protein